MVLREEDKRLLLSWGFEERDLLQIEETLRADKTVYTLENKRIGRNQAIELLGRRDFLSGIARSAFHFTAARETTDGEVVYFDSHKLFK